MRVSTPSASRPAWCALGVLILCAGCSGDEPVVVGSESPPASFGATEATFLGCAPVTGLYAWPPVDGEADDGRLPRLGGPPLPQLMPTELPLFNHAQLWIDDRNGLRLASRMVNRDPKLRIGALTEQWGFHELSNLDCDGGRWQWSAPPADELSRRAGVERARLADTGAESMSSGLVLQHMADGRLAIGQWQRLRFRASGRNGPPAAGESRLDPPDRIEWRWSLLARLGDTGEGVPPDDAALTPRAAPATR